MKITDSPGPIEVTPFRATAMLPAAPPLLRELSSIFQPVMFTALEPVLVSSNQSAPKVVALDQGATSEMMIVLAADAGTAAVGDRAGTTARSTTRVAIARSAPRDRAARLGQRGRTAN